MVAVIMLPGWTLESKFQSLPVKTSFDLTDVNAKKEVFFKVNKDGDYEFNLDFLYTSIYVRKLCVIGKLDLNKVYKYAQ